MKLECVAAAMVKRLNTLLHGHWRMFLLFINSLDVVEGDVVLCAVCVPCKNALPMSNVKALAVVVGVDSNVSDLSYLSGANDVISARRQRKF